MDAIGLFRKLDHLRDDKPVNVVGSIDDILLEDNSNSWSDVKPLNKAESMDDIWLEYK